MLDFLFFVGQVFSLVGIGYGAFLVLRHSELFAAFHTPHRSQRGSETHPVAHEEDAHGTHLGYWP